MLLGCWNRIASSTDYDHRFKAEYLLTRNSDDSESHMGRNYWLTPDREGGEFVLDLGCEKYINLVELINTHNADYRDRSTKRFQVFVSKKENGPWEKVLEKTLEDSTSDNHPYSVQHFQFSRKLALYIKFKVLSYYGKGGGLSHFTVAGEK